MTSAVDWAIKANYLSALLCDVHIYRCTIVFDVYQLIFSHWCVFVTTLGSINTTGWGAESKVARTRS